MDKVEQENIDYYKQNWKKILNKNLRYKKY